MSSKFKQIFLLLLIILLLGFLELLRELPCIFFCDIGKETLHYGKIIRTLNRAQQVYYFENLTFSSSLKKLDLDLDFQNRKYLIDSTNKIAFHQIESSLTSNSNLRNGAPLFYFLRTFNSEPSPIYTVAGSVFVLDNSDNREIEFKTIICKSETSGWQQLNRPYLQDGKLICGKGTKEY